MTRHLTSASAAILLVAACSIETPTAKIEQATIQGNCLLPATLDVVSTEWCERTATGVVIADIPVMLPDGRVWYKLIARLPGDVSVGEVR